VKVVSSPVVEGTDTEAKVLRLLAKGPRTSAQIKDEVSRSREHTARLMKGLFERGLVVRNDRNNPMSMRLRRAEDLRRKLIGGKMQESVDPRVPKLLALENTSVC